jgi:hypothetical protein
MSCLSRRSPAPLITTTRCWPAGTAWKTA